MRYPLTNVERSVVNQRNWYAEEERKSREGRGDLGAMEFWVRLTRARMAKEAKAGRGDVHCGFSLVCQLFLVAMDRRASGDARTWNDVLRYAEAVLEAHGQVTKGDGGSGAGASRA